MASKTILNKLHTLWL